MNVKGLLLDRVLINKIHTSFDTISLQNLRGIDVFNSFSWIGFSKEEFGNLLALFVHLDSEGFFRNISDKHKFIFNYSTDVTEMDIAGVLKSKEGDLYFLDIESKNDVNKKDLKEKVKKQVKKRKNEYLPQLLKDKNFITVGYANNEFVCGYFVKGDYSTEIKDEAVFKSFVSNMTGYDDQNDFLLQSSNLASIVKLCKDIQIGNYQYYEETNKIYDNLISKIGVDDVSIVYGNAGTGKSVLALKLFFENKDSKILLLNSKLYYAFNFNSNYYSSGRATFSSHEFIKSIDNNTISIVDECQRMNIDELVKIISKSKITFLFGDHKQAFANDSTLENHDQLKEVLTQKYGFKVSSKKINKSHRYKDEVNKALECLTALSENKTDIRLPVDYEIKAYYDQKAFCDRYELLSGIKKLYTPIFCSSNELHVGEKVFLKARYDDDTFSIWPSSDNYYGITYHALSFDIDHCFVYLKNVRMIKFQGKQYIFRGDCDPISFEDIQRFLNELNILFTSGRKSLHILIDDVETYLYINSLLSKLK